MLSFRSPKQKQLRLLRSPYFWLFADCAADVLPWNSGKVKCVVLGPWENPHPVAVEFV